MAPIPKELSLTPEQLDELMLSSWNMRIATIGPGTRINLTPLWFGWAGGKIYTYCRGQKVVNLRRNPSCTIVVDRNERFPELQGAMFQGSAKVLETAEEENADPDLEEIRMQMGAKYAVTGKVQASDERTDDARRVQYFLFMQVLELETGVIRFQHKSYITKMVR